VLLQQGRDLAQRPVPADETRQRGRETMHATGRGDRRGSPHAGSVTAGRTRRTALASAAAGSRSGLSAPSAVRAISRQVLPAWRRGTGGPPSPPAGAGAAQTAQRAGRRGNATNLRLKPVWPLMRQSGNRRSHKINMLRAMRPYTGLTVNQQVRPSEPRADLRSVQVPADRSVTFVSHDRMDMRAAAEVAGLGALQGRNRASAAAPCTRSAAGPRTRGDYSWSRSQSSAVAAVQDWLGLPSGAPVMGW